MISCFEWTLLLCRADGNDTDSRLRDHPTNLAMRGEWKRVGKDERAKKAAELVLVG